MNRSSLILTGAVASLAALLFSAAKSLPQNSSTSEIAQSEVTLVKLSPLVYPPFARQTRSTGNIELTLTLGRDRTVESAVVVSGHPLLQQAALDSARQSQCDGGKCGDETTAYHLIYTFRLNASADCCKNEAESNKSELNQPFPHITQYQNQVTVVDQPLCICDPGITPERVRSLKCLYLWKCGFR